MCDVSGPSTAAVIALNAIGAQDTHLLSDDTDKSHFKYDTYRHTDYAKFHRITQVDNKTKQKYWPFGLEGNTVKVTLNPQVMGDLLANMYLVVELPRCMYGRYVGRNIFKSISFRVDEIEVEKIYDDWQVIYDELYLEDSEKDSNDYLLNRMMYPVNSQRNEEKQTLNGLGALSTIKTIIPLRFFFSRKYSKASYETNKQNKPFFPLCSIHKQKIILEIEFHSVYFFSKPVTTDAFFEPRFTQQTDFDFPTLQDFKIVTEEITLSPEDRYYYVNSRYENLINLVYKNPSADNIIGAPNIKNNLVPAIAVKCIHWFVRKKAYEYQDPINDLVIGTPEFQREYQNKYVREKINLIDTRYVFEKIDSAKMYLNSLDLPNVSVADHNYFKYYTTHQARLSCPEKNIYTYSFSMNPFNTQSTGSLDFSNFNSDKTFIDVKLQGGVYTTDAFRGIPVDRLSEETTLYIYYTGYKLMSFEKGFMSLND